MSLRTVARLTQCALIAVVAWPQPALAGTDEETDQSQKGAALPPPRIEDLAPKSPQPSFDVALVAAACGVGTESIWQVTKFCMAGMGDVLFGRSLETEAGVGAYAQLGTAGFRDVRVGGGLLTVVPLIDWFGISMRAGGFASAGRGAAAPGVEGYLEFGHRSVSHRSHYSISHALLTGIQYSPATQTLPQEHVLWIGLRLDAIWLTAPVALFR